MKNAGRNTPMKVSKKNQPVVDRLFLLLATAEEVAAAILDNAIDDQEPLDTTVRLNLTSKLINIADSLDKTEL